MSTWCSVATNVAPRAVAVCVKVSMARFERVGSSADKGSSTKKRRALDTKARASPTQTQQDRRRIKELERDLRRKNDALAETTALLVLSKKFEVIFHKGEAE